MERVRNLILLAVLAAIGCADDKVAGPEKHADLRFHGFTSYHANPAGGYWHVGEVTNEGERNAVNVVPTGPDFVGFQWETQTAGTPLPSLGPRGEFDLSISRPDTIPPDSVAFTYQEGDLTL
jgi:hypothetical protein